MMCANLHGHRTERGQFLDQLVAVRKIGVVRFVVAEIGVDRLERALLRGGVHVDFDRALSLPENGEQQARNDSHVTQRLTCKSPRRYLSPSPVDDGLIDNT